VAQQEPVHEESGADLRRQNEKQALLTRQGRALGSRTTQQPLEEDASPELASHLLYHGMVPLTRDDAEQVRGHTLGKAPEQCLSLGRDRAQFPGPSARVCKFAGKLEEWSAQVGLGVGTDPEGGHERQPADGHFRQASAGQQSEVERPQRSTCLEHGCRLLPLVPGQRKRPGQHAAQELRS
jgi:hypothetical protein